MKAWIRSHSLAFTRSIGALFRQPIGSLLNLLVIAITAAFPLALWLIVSSVADVTKDLSVEPQLSIFMLPSAEAEQVAALKQQLKQDTRLKQVIFVPKDEALKKLQSSFGSADLLAGMTENPLPDAFVVHAKDAQPEALEALQKEWAAVAGVEEVQLDSEWARRLARISALGQNLFEVVAVMLGAALVLITGNAIRMQILTRRDEIEVAKLIGATDAFIRRPFIHSAILQGFLGGLLAVAMVWGVISHINPAIEALAKSYGQQFSLQTPDVLSTLLVCALIAALCLLGALIAVTRHLRQFR
ncbi:FtsX-like permease family protein [Chitinibacter bivalviorum]|uniref:Cell division protein FtsX n=1 Tax=Chitinibacter bivalviorum TaxID=2739434 RepID=A0A7H9BM05_9NEIS|nr:permease-like cell division protein FtsX [Chitinibacter bivalviorum]QLG89426.1 FtsX-like permease family protein [Chitinibacter bivalviorum]